VVEIGRAVVFPTLCGLNRGEGVFDNFWKLIEYAGKITFVINCTDGDFRDDAARGDCRCL